MGVYDDHLKNKKWAKDENEFKKKHRQGKKLERTTWHNSSSVTVGSNPAYRDGWDRIKKNEEAKKSESNS